MPQRGKKQSKEAAILRAAAELFAEKDFHQVLMEEVALRAQVGKGTLYRYFPAKEDLYLATIFAGWDQHHKELEAVLQQEGSLDEILEKTARQILAYFWQRRLFVTLVYRLEHKPSGKEKSDWQRRRESIVRLVEGVMKRKVFSGTLPTSDARLLVEIFFGMIRAAILYRGNRDTPEALARQIVNLFLDGLRGRARQSERTRLLSGGNKREREAALL
ncbi:MAG TPA: TetR/AcrR family transcriptional regulator [Candidatus Binatia bacterium]|jgi:AcrR family transcriptional regulator|nr:TetR/AcrR family transcriptional regulator [Candidatus Binatia bacterium]